MKIDEPENPSGSFYFPGVRYTGPVLEFGSRELSLTLNVALIREWVTEAGAIARHYFRRADPQWKGVADPVTVADREIEQLLRRAIQATYPDHGLLGEEYGAQQIDHEYLWIIDPIDGTRAYVEGLPSWCITLAVLHRRVPIFGLVHLPLYDDWTYIDGDDVIANGEIVTGRLARRWAEDSYVLWRSDAGSRYDLRFTRAMSMGSTAAHTAYTARGASVATLSHEGYAWDIAAGAAFMARQGGEIRFLSGERLDFATADLTHKFQGLYAIGHPDVVRRLLPLVSERPEPVHHPAW